MATAVLPVTDDQFALATANGDECVERLEAGLHRFIHRLARDDAGRLDFNAAALRGLERALAVDGIAKAVHNATEQFLANGNVHKAVDTGDTVTNREHGADFAHFGFSAEIGDLVLDDL